ncbi:ABC transporter permease [Virgibacillus oceani]
MTIFQFALKRTFSNTTNLIFLTLFPIGAIFLPSGEAWPFLPYGYQYFGIIVLFVGIRLANIILEDRQKGVVKRLAVAPVTHFQYLSQNLLSFAVIMVIQCIILVYGGMLYGHELYQPGWLIVLFISFSFSSLAIALAWISLYRSTETSFLVYMSLIFLLVLLGGLLVPLETFPDILKRIAVVFPTYWLSQGIDWIVFGEEISEFLMINGVLWLYTVIFLVIGSVRRIN